MNKRSPLDCRSTFRFLQRVNEVDSLQVWVAHSQAVGFLVHWTWAGRQEYPNVKQNYRYTRSSTNYNYSQTSVHEQFGLRTNFPNTKRLEWLLCLELRTRKPSTSWSDKLGVSASAVFVEEWSSGNTPSQQNRSARASVAVYIWSA
jgi:hypothetical protein